MRSYTLTKTKNEQKLHILRHTKKPPAPKGEQNILRARCSQPLSTNQTPHPTTKMERHQQPDTQAPKPEPEHRPTHTPQQGRDRKAVASKPNSVFGNPHHDTNPKAGTMTRF